MEYWAEIRRLHRSEKVPVKEIARRLGIARNTVRAALASTAPPRYERAAKGSIVDAVEPQICALLKDHPRMPATVIAERIAWDRSMTVLKDRVRQLRPLYLPADPVDKLVHEPGDTTQCDLWFPEPRIPVGGGQDAMLPVLVMTLAFSKVISARMIPSRTAEDILMGMWAIISSLGAVTKTLWWDRESAVGASGKPSAPMAAFAGTLGTRIVLAPPRDPETKGMVERTNGYFETSFLPGRQFTSPQDFNAQLGAWLPRANERLVRSLAPATGSGAGGRPIDVLDRDLAAMSALPPVAPSIGTRMRIRLGREYYVRVATCDYSVDPHAIGRLVDVLVTLERVRVTCAGALVADHARCWARRQVITDAEHVAAAAVLRGAYQQSTCAAQAKTHRDAHPVPVPVAVAVAVPVAVAVRALADYDELFATDLTNAAGAAERIS